MYTQITYSEVVTMAFGEKVPPYVFPETHKGIELDIIKEALAYKGHSLSPKYYPLARVALTFNDPEINAVVTDSGTNLSNNGGYYAKPAVTYSNVFITLKESQIRITNPKDLSRYSVVSFQGAAKRYPYWLDSISKSKRYLEINSQETQVKLLISKRYDIVLSDKNIFKYFSKLYSEANQHVHTKTFNEIEFIELNPNNYRPIFKSKKVRDDFNEGLDYLKSSGRFQEIFNQYLK